MEKRDLLTAKEAAAELQVSRATLYSYVSRGLVRSEAVGDNPRDRRYHAEDIQRLKQRKDLRKNPGKAAEQALRWGLPVLESHLTLITAGRVYYRGVDACQLAVSSSLEEVGWLLWLGEKTGKQSGKNKPDGGTQASRNFVPGNLTGIPALQAALLQAEAQDAAAYDLRPESVAHKGPVILRMLAQTAVGGKMDGDKQIASYLQQAWAPERPQAEKLINAALVLCADHELNVSAFTARCVASAGSSPYAAVLSGLAALQGGKHGGVSRRVAALLAEVRQPDRAGAVLSARLQRGEAIPGFGHVLYPEGDPRAKLLLHLLRGASNPGELDLEEAIIREALQLIHEEPTIDFALLSLVRWLKLPEETAITLFALGRTVGWIAHAIEQYRMDTLIRPRAKYVGPKKP